MVTAETIGKIINIFEENSWDTNNEKNYLFDRFTRSLDMLEVDDQEFMIEITKKYKQYAFSDYEEMLSECLVEMSKSKYFAPKKGQEIIFAPLLKYSEGEYSYKETKSSNLMSYLIKADKNSYLKFIGQVNIRAATFLDYEDIGKIKDKKASLVLIDDYIGSGNTACESVESYVKAGVALEDISIISLLIDTKGSNLLTEKNIAFFTSSKKHYTVYDIYEDNDELRNRIKRISRKIGAPKRYYLGYKDTMALVSLIRTPNNTLPFYWVTSKKNKGGTPFPRSR